MKTLLFLALLLPLAVGAQVKKCQIDGKTVYSDSQCGQQGAAVNVSPNTVDGSGLRGDAQRMRQDDELASLRANPPTECRFKYHAYGDPKGKALAEKAKAECIQNIVDAGQGKPASLVAYGMWKDHHGLVSADRRAAANRASAATDATNIANSNRAAISGAARAAANKPNVPLKCTKDHLAITPSITCR